MTIRTINVVCVKSSNQVFNVGSEYQATLDGENWKVKSSGGYSYNTLRGMWGAIYHKSSHGHFGFEPVMKD